MTSPSRPSAPRDDSSDGDPRLEDSIALVQRAQSGSQEALGDLFRRYEERVRRIVRIELGREIGRFFDEDDVLQEVWTVAARKMGEFELRSHASIRRWFVTIAKNKILDHLKYLHAQRRDVRRDGPRIAEGEGDTISIGPRGLRLESHDTSPSMISQRREYEELLDQKIEQLQPPEYREVILLANYYGESWDEIAERLDRPTVAAAQELYRRAKLKLREALRPYRSSLEGDG